MDAERIRRLEAELTGFLERFADCFQREDTRAHLPVYVRGQLSELPRKSVEPMALAAGVPVRTLQEFLTHLKWDEDRMRQRVARIVAEEHAHEESIGIIDETGWVKKGDQTPGVQRQYCGSVGKRENSIITVHLGYMQLPPPRGGGVALPAGRGVVFAGKLECGSAAVPTGGHPAGGCLSPQDGNRLGAVRPHTGPGRAVSVADV